MSRTVHCRTLSLLLWVVLTRWSAAQTNPAPATFRVDHIGVNDGLTQGSVYYMLKDSRNFMWFCTQDGLNRYDGHRFRTYHPVADARRIARPGVIRGVNVQGIVEDPDHNLWVGTEEGLNRYDRRRDRFDLLFTTGPDQKSQSGRTLPFYVDKTDLLYLSDAEGLVRYNYRTGRKTILSADFHPDKEYILPNSTVRTPAGDIWLHAPKGLLRYNLRDQTVSSYFSDRPASRIGPAQTIFSFFIDGDNIAWLGTDTGLIRFDYHRNTCQTYKVFGNQPVSAVYSIAADQGGRLWLGTQHDGVLYFDKRSRQFGQVNDFTNDTRRLSEFQISKVYVDPLGIIWANPDPDGLARIIPDAFVFGGMVKRQANNAPADQQLNAYEVRGFAEEQPDRIWVATMNGINVLNPRTNRVVQRFLTNAKRSDQPLYTAVRSLYRDPQRRMWVGTPDGVLAYQAKTQTFDLFGFPAATDSAISNNVRSMVSVADTLLIAATENGLYALNTRRHTLSKLPYLPGMGVFSLWYDAPRRQLWAGTYLRGYHHYQLPVSKAQHRPWRRLKAGLNGYTVLHIRPDSVRQSLWLACNQGLLELRPQTGNFQLYGEQQGLANAFVYGSNADAKNAVWMSTNRGVSRLEPGTRIIKNFMISDGLQGYEFNSNAYLKTANGDLYFGGVNGFNRFRPEQFTSSLFDPHVHIYSLTVNEKPFVGDTTYVGEAGSIRLNHDQNTLSLEFAALDYVSNGHNAYKYQLMNYDEDWVSAGERNYVRYANLPPGDYKFQVKAANKDARWGKNVHELIIRIDPPFWQEAPFILLVVFLLGVAVLAWVRQRENAIRRQQADRLRLAYDIQEQVKKDIARDLHDEIGTRLATIKLYTTQLTQRVGETPDILSLKTTIFNLINDTISDVRNLLRKLNPQTLEQHGYVAAVEELIARINATGVIKAQVILDERLDAPLVDIGEADALANSRFPANTEVMLYRITQELINNSLKHANAHQINLQIQRQPDRLLLTYTDDGRGFDRTLVRQKSTGLGLGSIESRVAILNGRISWQQPEQGTRVLIDVPIGNVLKRGTASSRTRSSLPG